MYVANKEKIIAKEHELLRVLSFDVELDLPHKYLLNIARYLSLSFTCILWLSVVIMALSVGASGITPLAPSSLTFPPADT